MSWVSRIHAALFDEVVGVGLDLVAAARGDQLPHPPGVHVDAQSRAAERGRRPLQHVPHQMRTGRRHGQPLGTDGQPVLPQPPVDLCGAVPHPVVELDDPLGRPGRPAAVEDVEQPGAAAVTPGDQVRHRDLPQFVAQVGEERQIVHALDVPPRIEGEPFGPVQPVAGAGLRVEVPAHGGAHELVRIDAVGRSGVQDGGGVVHHEGSFLDRGTGPCGWRESRRWREA